MEAALPSFNADLKIWYEKRAGLHKSKGFGPYCLFMYEINSSFFYTQQHSSVSINCALLSSGIKYVSLHQQVEYINMPYV
jgi:hypothetical protein